MIFEQSVLHKLNMKTSQSRDSDITGTNCDVIKENLASLSRSDDVIVTYSKIHSRHTSISYNSCGVDEGFSLTYAGQTTIHIFFDIYSIFKNLKDLQNLYHKYNSFHLNGMYSDEIHV